MGKFFFTLQQSYKQREKIYAIQNDNHRITTITRLNCDELKSKGINYIALDFDGVLAAHGQPLPNKHITKWLKTFSNKFGEKNIFILSNKPTSLRAKYFAENFPYITFVNNVKKKPYPDGLMWIQKKTNCVPQELALVDDRILTGCLACVLANSFPILITSPFTDFRKRPLQESFFGILRKIENYIFTINNNV